jgi:hypothetical protein
VADLTVVELDQIAQRFDALEVGVAELEFVEPAWPVSAEDVVEPRASRRSFFTRRFS